MIFVTCFCMTAARHAEGMSSSIAECNIRINFFPYQNYFFIRAARSRWIWNFKFCCSKGENDFKYDEKLMLTKHQWRIASIPSRLAAVIQKHRTKIIKEDYWISIDVYFLSINSISYIFNLMNITLAIFKPV